MHIEITQVDGELPFITKLPDFGIGQLEGYNGVGKSLTVSVLELCAGVRPHMEPQAWRGLCDGMGSLTVVASRLRRATSIRWVIDGALLWEQSKDADLVAPPTISWFAEVLIDNDPAQSLEDVRRLFAVERVNGDVGLTEALAGQADLAVRELEQFAASTLDSDALASTEANVGGLRRLLEDISVDRIMERANDAERQRRQRDAAEKVMRDALNHRARLEDALRLRSRLEEIAVRGAELDAAIADVDSQIAAVTKERRSVAYQLEQAEKDAAQTEDLRAELARATRRYKSANTRLGNVTRDLAKATQRAGLADDDAVAQWRADLQAQLAESRLRRVESDAGPAIMELIDAVHTPIAHAAGQGLADQTLLSAPARAPSAWTVVEVSAALEQRREELSDIPSPRDAQRIDEDIAHLMDQLAALADVERLRRQRAAAEERLNEAQQRSHDLTVQLGQATSAQLDDLRDTRRSLDNKLSELGGERTVLVYRRDALGAPQERDVLRGQLERLLGEFGIDADEIDSAYSAIVQTAEAERAAYVAVRDAERIAAGEHERDLAHVGRTIDVLRDDNRYGWLRSAPLPPPDPEQPLADQLQLLGRLQAAARRADDRLTAFRQLFPGLRASLEAVSDQLRGRTPKAEIRVDAVFAWLEGDAATWFADADFRSALLDEDASQVSVDLRTRQVTWISSGARHAKPIEALSSGERAFAFTQARLSLLQQRGGRVPNRLIALDEFGAFVSANRIRQLSVYLQRWREMHEGDQILVVLPANQDYETLARATEGERAARYRRMADSLRRRAWFVEEFDTA